MGFSIKGKEIISSGDELSSSSTQETEESAEELVVPLPTPSEEEAQ